MSYTSGGLKMAGIRFQVGNYEFHKEPNFNFQLNRVQKLGADIDVIKRIGSQATDAKSYVELMLQAAEDAEKEGNMRAAGAYLRGADFFTPARDGKLEIYHKYKQIFYELNEPMIKENNVRKVMLPFDNGYIPVLYCTRENPKGTVLIHGGFDSYVEEFLKFMVYVYQHGYDAYIFEGPGQGTCINDYHMPFIPDWNRPVTAICDYFHLDDVALVGISFGSLLCKLAAAKEPRIRYVLSVGLLTEWPKFVLAHTTNENQKIITEYMEKQDREGANAFLRQLAKEDPMYEWYFEQGTNTFGVETPYDFLKIGEQYTILPYADQLTQDYLCIAGATDHFISLDYVQDEVDALKNVRSFTLRIIEPPEKGDDHCNVSNRKLMLDYFLNWLEETKTEKKWTEEAAEAGYVIG